VPRKADVTAVAAIFEQDHDSPESAALAAITALDEARRSRLGYAVAIQGLPVAYLYHGFETRQEAINWLKATAVDVAGLSVGIVPVFNKDEVLSRHQAQTEELRKKQEPGHPTPGRRKRS